MRRGRRGPLFPGRRRRRHVHRRGPRRLVRRRRRHQGGHTPATIRAKGSRRGGGRAPGRGVDPGAVTRLVHGTTLATNVILEQARTRYRLRHHGRVRRPAPPRPRVAPGRRTLRPVLSGPPPSPSPVTAPSRSGSGSTRAGGAYPLDDGELADARRRASPRTGRSSVAICLLHSYANPGHERAVGGGLPGRARPDAFVVTSSEVWPEMREYERAMTTVMCAYVAR